MASLSSAGPAHTFVVRNTFVCVIDSEEDPIGTAGPVARRSQSAPELPRLAPVDVGTTETACAEAELLLEPSSSCSSSPYSTPSTSPTTSTPPGHVEEDNVSESMQCEARETEEDDGQSVRRSSSSSEASDRLAACMTIARSAAFVLSNPSTGILYLLRALAEGGRPVALEVAAALGPEGMATLARCPAAAPIFEEFLLSLATSELRFIAEAIAPEAGALALQPQGQVAICGLLNLGQDQAFTIALADEVLKSDIASLCCHKYGHQVAISLVSNGLAHHKQAIVQSLCQDLQRFARHRFASKVAVQIAMSSSWQESQPLLDALLEQPAGAARAACHIFGMELVSAFLTQQAFHAQVAESCSLAVHRMVKDKYGRAILKQLGMSAQVPMRPAQAWAASATQRGSAVSFGPSAQVLPSPAKPLPLAPFFLQPMVLAPHLGVAGGA